MPEPSNLQVVLMGLCTVFLCLLAIIVIIQLMSWLIRRFAGKSVEAENVPAAPMPTQSVAQTNHTNRNLLLAVISVALAEEMGTDVSRLRIHELKELGKAK